MIAHFSIPARDPQATAELFARLIDGVVTPFHVVDGAWMVLARDGSGAGVEVIPDTAVITAGEGAADGAQFTAAPREAIAGPTAIHVALTSALSTDEVIALGQAAGWRALHADRGPFDLVELWVDNRIMIEVLPPAGAARYMASVQAQLSTAGAAAEFA